MIFFKLIFLTPIVLLGFCTVLYVILALLGGLSNIKHNNNQFKKAYNKPQYNHNNKNVRYDNFHNKSTNHPKIEKKVINGKVKKVEHRHISEYSTSNVEVSPPSLHYNVTFEELEKQKTPDNADIVYDKT